MKPSRMAAWIAATLCGAWGRNTVAALDDWPTSLSMSKYWVRRRRSITSFGDVPGNHSHDTLKHMKQQAHLV